MPRSIQMTAPALALAALIAFAPSDATAQQAVPADPFVVTQSADVPPELVIGIMSLLLAITASQGTL